jgi:hypothetical protein
LFSSGGLLAGVGECGVVDAVGEFGLVGVVE